MANRERERSFTPFVAREVEPRERGDLRTQAVVRRVRIRRRHRERDLVGAIHIRQ